MLGSLSLYSVHRVNALSNDVFDENVKNTKMLNEITETMYVCRVLGRDILLQPDDSLRGELYTQYIISFKKLDYQMDEFSKMLTGEKHIVFDQIITSKDIYKTSMILSADIINEGGDFNDALEALRSVTPIANKFFGSIDKFLTEEMQLMSDILERNDTTLIWIFVTAVIVYALTAIGTFLLNKSFAKTMSDNLVALERTVTEIANTGNMTLEIPNYLFTLDEIGLIATATNKLKTMLLDYSSKDALTSGYNTTAYYEKLSQIFDNRIDSDPPIEFWCISFDMNDLKLINDQFGHFDGDEAIKGVHSIIIECFSEYGKTYRLGGDEFFSILNNCSEADIKSKLDIMKSRIEEENQKTVYFLSIAYGYGKFKGNTKYEFANCFKAVDKKMYRNKARIKQAQNDIIN